MRAGRRTWTLSRLTVAFDVLPEGLASLPDDVSPLGEGQTDPVFEWLLERGEIIGDANPRGFYPMVCPQCDSHTPSNDPHNEEAGYKPGRPGAFKCLHAHCSDFTTKQFREWILDNDPQARLDIVDGINLGAIGARIAAAVGRSTERRPGNADGVRFSSPQRSRERDGTMAATIRAAVLENYISVETKDGYWSCRAWDMVRRPALDDALTALMQPHGLLDGVTPTGRPTVIAPHVWFRRQPDAQRVSTITHQLGQPLIIDDCLNIAEQIPEPIEADGVPEPWLDLVDFVCDDDDVADQILDWLAMTVGAWDEKPGWHVLMKGTSGVGKDLIIAPVKTYLTRKHWYGLTVKVIESGFTNFLTRRLVVLDEIKRTTRGELNIHDVYNTIKAWTARGTGWVIINDKNLKHYTALDLSCWWLTSNASVPLPLEEADRRWAVVNTPRQVRPKGYYLAIVDWLEKDEGWKVVVGWLQRRWATMSEERRNALRGPAPMTLAKRQLIMNSSEGIEGAVRQGIAGTHGEPWPDLMRAEDVEATLRGSSLLSDSARRTMTARRIALAMEEAGAVPLHTGADGRTGQVEYPAGRRMRLWCMRLDKVEKYRMMGKGKAIVDAYDEQRGVASGGLKSAGSNIIPLKGRIPSH